MRPTQFSETVAVAPLPAYEQFSVESKFTFESVKRHKTGVGLSQVQTPCNYARAIICNRPFTTSKRFISRLDMAPKYRPRKFAQTIYVSPKNPERTYTAIVRHHVEGRRKWYTSKVEMEPTLNCKLTPSGRHELDIDENTGRVFRTEWTPTCTNEHIMNGDVEYTDNDRLFNGYHEDLRSYQSSGPYGYFDQDEEDDEISI
jgi:hypothetical protein